MGTPPCVKNHPLHHSDPDISVWVRHCPRCDRLRVTNMKTIRPAMFGGSGDLKSVGNAEKEVVGPMK